MSRSMPSTHISSLETGRQSPVQTVKLNCGAAQWIGLLSASWRIGQIPSANTGNNRVTNRYKIVIPPRTDISFLGSFRLRKSRSIFPKLLPSAHPGMAISGFVLLATSCQLSVKTMKKHTARLMADSSIRKSWISGWILPRIKLRSL